MSENTATDTQAQFNPEANIASAAAAEALEVLNLLSVDANSGGSCCGGGCCSSE